VFAGTSGAIGPSLLPRRLKGALNVPSTRVRLGVGEGLRYGPARVTGTAFEFKLFVVPATVGTVTIGCFGPAESTLPRTCDAVAGSVSLNRGDLLVATPNPVYSRRVRRLVVRADSVRATLHGRLGDADSYAKRAEAASGAAKKLKMAGRDPDHLRLAPADARADRRVRAALEKVRSAYTRIAAAAKDADRERFNSALEAARSAERSLAAAVRALRRLGYRDT
jgi:hypothetical protein